MKTLSDATARLVDFTAVPTTVAELAALAKPDRLPQDSRIAPLEMTVYTLAARLVEAVSEEDSDIHLIVADLNDPSITMIVEFPLADCTLTTDEGLRFQMQNARDAFTAAFGVPGATFIPLSGTAQITGVGFWDRIHGQRGVAPNGVELHPVLDFVLTEGAAVP